MRQDGGPAHCAWLLPSRYAANCKAGAVILWFCFKKEEEKRVAYQNFSFFLETIKVLALQCSETDRGLVGEQSGRGIWGSFAGIPLCDIGVDVQVQSQAVRRQTQPIPSPWTWLPGSGKAAPSAS